MKFHAKHVSTDSSVGGDYYQVSFSVEDDDDDLTSDSPYLLIQRDFEPPCDARCYVEMHDERYCGHFLLRHIDFTPEGLTIELDRKIDNRILVTFRLGSSEFEKASHVIKIISGEIEPDSE